MKTLFYLVVIIAVAGVAWVRFAPHDRDRWHVDPAEAGDPGRSGIRLIGREAPRFPGEASEVLQAFLDIALAEPRVRVLDGSLDEGMVTLVARTKVMGYPDYVTVKAVDEGAQTKLSVASRARFGSSDWGVNRERLDRWLAELEFRLVK